MMKIDSADRKMGWGQKKLPPKREYRFYTFGITALL